MSGDRLDKGFVTWQGRRVFVPWLGAPRIVPTADDEVRVVTIRFRLHIAMAILVIPFMVLGVWLGDPEGFAGVPIGISVIFGTGALLESRRVWHWPILATSKFGPSRFLLGYFRGLPIMARVDALGWSGLAFLLCVLMFLMIVVKLVDNADDGWLLAKLTLALLGPGALCFLTLRHAAMASISLVPLFANSKACSIPMTTDNV